MDQASTASPKWTDLGVRVASAVVMIPVVVAAAWAGGVWFTLLVGLLGVLMAFEWVTICHKQDQPQLALHAGAALAGAMLPSEAGLAAAATVIAVIWLASAAAAYARDSSGAKWHYLGVLYVSLPAVALVLLRGDAAQGFLAIIWVMVTVWAADSLAYFAGRIIGGPKLAPILSPKKTWAGLGGAIAGSAAASLVFALAMGLPGVAMLALLAGALAIVEQAGDLFKSAMKRFHGVKESGRLIPGHGGIIDRVDGLVAVASAAAIIGWARGGMDATGAGLLAW